MKILVGVDDSKFSADIVRAIVTQFRAENSEVLVLHVLQPVGPAIATVGSRWVEIRDGEGGSGTQEGP
jgi:hypothetical protein